MKAKFIKIKMTGSNDVAAFYDCEIYKDEGMSYLLSQPMIKLVDVAGDTMYIPNTNIKMVEVADESEVLELELLSITKGRRERGYYNG